MIAYRKWALLIAVAGVSAFIGCSEDVDTPATAGTPGAGGGAGGQTSVTSSSTTSGGGSAPLSCPVTYTDVGKDECDLLDQDCPPGMTCRPVLTMTGWKSKCRGDTGLKGPGKSCVYEQECQAGLFCIGDPPDAWCSPICCPATNEPCGGASCNVEVAFDTAYAMMCSFAAECQLLTANACETGECHVSDPTQGLATCIPPNGTNAGEGQPCTYLNDCGDMQHCLPPPDNICRYYCSIGGDPTQPPGLGGCPAGQSCTAVNLGVDGVGLCAPSSP